jgi:hypothetical protein
MAILDGLLQFTGVAGVTTVGSGTGQGTAGMGDDPMLTAITTSNNVIDLLNARDMGIGDDPAMKLAVSVSVAGVGGTSMIVSVQGSVDNSTWVTLATGPQIITANLIVGTYLLAIDLPRMAGSLHDRPGATMGIPRYYRLGYTAAGTFTAGRFFGHLVLDRQDQLSYPPGIVIAN